MRYAQARKYRHHSIFQCQGFETSPYVGRVETPRGSFTPPRIHSRHTKNEKKKTQQLLPPTSPLRRSFLTTTLPISPVAPTTSTVGTCVADASQHKRNTPRQEAQRTKNKHSFDDAFFLATWVTPATTRLCEFRAGGPKQEGQTKEAQWTRTRTQTQSS